MEQMGQRMEKSGGKCVCGWRHFPMFLISFTFPCQEETGDSQSVMKKH